MNQLNYQHFDATVMDTLKMIMGNDIIELFRIYERDSKLRLHTLEQLITTSAEPKQIRLVAHSLKGSSSNVGASQMAELCNRLEQMALSESLEQAEQTLLDLKQHYSDIQAELKHIILNG